MTAAGDLTAPEARLAELERQSATLHRRSERLKVPTTPAEEAAYLAECDAIDAETAEVDAAFKAARRELRRSGQQAGKA